MTNDAVRLLEEALRLEPAARAALAGSLLESLDEAVDEDAEAAWKAEIAKRVERVRLGAVRPMRWSEARRAIGQQ